MMIVYEPTQDKIRLTEKQDQIMTQMINHVQESVSVLKKTTRWQFWVRVLWDDGYAAGKKDQDLRHHYEALNQYLHAMDIEKISLRKNLVEQAASGLDAISALLKMDAENDKEN